MHFLSYFAASVIITACCASSSLAGLMTTDGYSGPLHIMFVTNTVFLTGGNLGGVSGANDKVTAVANAGSVTSGMGLQWKAVISDSTQDAISIINDSHPVYNTNGDRIADNYAEVFGVLNGPGYPEYNESGSYRFGDVWTGTDFMGSHTGDSCNDWTDGAGSFVGDYGAATGSAGGHILAGFFNCAADLRLYGISTSAVPEPSSLLLLSLVGLVVSGKSLWMMFSKRLATSNS